METLAEGFEHQYVVLLFNTRTRSKAWHGPFKNLQEAHAMVGYYRGGHTRATVAVYTLVTA